MAGSSNYRPLYHKAAVLTTRISGHRDFSSRFHPQSAVSPADLRLVLSLTDCPTANVLYMVCACSPKESSVIYGRSAHTARHCIPPYASENNWNLITDTVKRIRNIDLQLHYTRHSPFFKHFSQKFQKFFLYFTSWQALHIPDYCLYYIKL